MRDVIDPELGVDIVSLGLVYGLDLDGRDLVVRATTTTPACPLGDYITAEIQRVLLASGAVDTVAVEITYEPPWTPQMMDRRARRKRAFAMVMSGGAAEGAAVPLLALGVFSLLVGLWAGLLLLGLHVPTWRSSTGGGSRAADDAGLPRHRDLAGAGRGAAPAWGYAAPAAAGSGGLALVAGLPGPVGWALLCLASVIFLLMYAVAFRISPGAAHRGDGGRRAVLVPRDGALAGRPGDRPTWCRCWPGSSCSPSSASGWSWPGSAC